MTRFFTGENRTLKRLRFLATWFVFCLCHGGLMGQLVLPGVRANKQVEIEITGMKTMTSPAVIELLGGRLDVVTGSAATPARADDAAFIVESFLRQKGFPEARVSWRIPSDRVIILTVAEGRLEKVREIRVIGLDEKQELVSEVKALAENRLRGGSDKSGWIAWLPERLGTVVADTMAFLQTRGYLDAKVEGKPVDMTEEGPVVELAIGLGPLYQMAPVNVTGIPAGQEQDIEERLATFGGRPATAENLVAAQSAIESALREQGFYFAGVYFSETHSGGRLNPVFTVEAGERYRFGTVRVEGIVKTKPGRVGQWFKGLGGVEYDESMVRSRVASLLATGAFEVVRSNAVPSLLEPDTLDLNILVEEGRARGLTAYVGAGSYEGFIIGGSYFNRNWLGHLLNLSVTGEYSGIGLLGETRVTDPRLWGSDISASGRIYTLLRQREGYGKWEGGLGLGLAKDMGFGWDLHLNADIRQASVFSDGIPVSELSPTSYFVQSLGLVAEYEHRDNPLAPSSGFYSKFLLEVGGITGDEAMGYIKNEASMMWLKKVSDTDHVSLSAAVGFILPSREGELPIDMRYFMGGADSIRSFPEREMGDQIRGGYPRGGETFWNASVEYVRKIKGPLMGVVFTDVGSLGEDFESFGSDEIKFAAGLGLRLDLPIGPVRLDYGYNLNRAEGEPMGALHFAIGLRF
jgi:outer membrane protein insertion porin family